MSRAIHVFRSPDRFVAGTVGQPGERAFYLQVADERRVVSIAVEKQQVTLLADRLDQLLEEILQPAPDPGLAAALADLGALEQPIDEEFRVGAMGLAWDEEDGLIVLEAQAPAEDSGTAAATLLDDEATEGPDAVRIRMSPAMAHAFVQRARRVVAAGRPPCPLCTLPLDPIGHLCPRLNGYRRPVTLAP